MAVFIVPQLFLPRPFQFVHTDTDCTVKMEHRDLNDAVLPDTAPIAS